MVQTYYLSTESDVTSDVVHDDSFRVTIDALCSVVHAAAGILWGVIRDNTDALWKSMTVSSAAQALLW